MRRILTGLSLMAVVLLSIYFLQYTTTADSSQQLSENVIHTDAPAYKIKEQYKGVKKRKKRNEKGIKYAAEYLELLKANPATGKIDPQDVIKAREQMLAQRNNASLRNSSLGLNWEEMGPDNVGGRTREILIDKDNNKKLFAGGVTGGLFVSENGGSSWTNHPNTSDFEFQGISCMVQASNGDIYFGTGESFVFTEQNIAGHLGGGVYKSSDQGQSFQLLTSTVPSTSNTSNTQWSYTNELAADPNNASIIYAANNGGLYVTFDGGNSWSKITNGLQGIDASRAARDVLVSPNGTVFASINRKGYRSDDGVNFTLIAGVNGFPSGDISRIEFAISPQDPNYVYVAMANSAQGLRGIYRSTDGGNNWEPYSPENSPTFNPLGSQGDYDLAFAVNPANKDEVFIGGQLDLYKGGKTLGWSLIGYWTPDSPTNPYYVHADMHTIIFDPTNPKVMYVGNDGGVFKTLNAQDQFPTFTARNKGYNVTQFYNIAAGLNGTLLGGAQDNGTSLIDGFGNTSLSRDEVTGGDGGFCEISKLNPLAIYTEIQYGTLRRSSNGGESFGCAWNNVIDADGNCRPDGSNFSLFIAPYMLWEEAVVETLIDTVAPGVFNTVYNNYDRGILVFGANNRVLVTPDALNFSTTPAWYRINLTGGAVSAIAKADDGTFFVGTENGYVHRISGLATAQFPNPPANGLSSPIGVSLKTLLNSSDTGGKFVAGLAVDPNNTGHLIVTMSQYGSSNYVLRTYDALTNGTPTFQSIQNNLPAMPVYDAVIDYYNEDNYILGTELGIWTSSDAGTTWVEENTNIPSVPVFTLSQEPLYESACQVIYAGTYGRGIFRTTSLLTLNNTTCDPDPFKNVVSVNEPISEIKTSALYPNPVVNEAILDLTLTKATQVDVMITGLIGSVNRTINLGKHPVGTHRFNLDFNGIPKGMYLVHVATQNGVQTKKVFVSK